MQAQVSSPSWQYSYPLVSGPTHNREPNQYGEVGIRGAHPLLGLSQAWTPVTSGKETTISRKLQDRTERAWCSDGTVGRSWEGSCLLVTQKDVKCRVRRSNMQTHDWLPALQTASNTHTDTQGGRIAAIDRRKSVQLDSQETLTYTQRPVWTWPLSRGPDVRMKAPRSLIGQCWPQGLHTQSDELL